MKDLADKALCVLLVLAVVGAVAYCLSHVAEWQYTRNYDAPVTVTVSDKSFYLGGFYIWGVQGESYMVSEGVYRACSVGKTYVLWSNGTLYYNGVLRLRERDDDKGH